MKLKNFFSFLDQFESIQGVEAKLRRRRRNGIIATLGTIIFGIIEIFRGLSDNETIIEYLSRVADATSNYFKFVWHIWQEWEFSAGYEVAYDVLGFYILLAGVLIYLLFRHTAFLFKLSEEPFLYTFWIEPFEKADKKQPSDDSIDNSSQGIPELDPQLEHEIESNLHHDVMNMLNLRIGRFSLLDEEYLTNNSADPDHERIPPTHIHVAGFYTNRISDREPGKENNGRQSSIIQVMPRVRIGPPGNPSTLTYQIEVEIKGDDQMRSEIYSQVLEQVYSKVASEIYTQIRLDVKEKIHLFPTKYLRATALYYEAVDFEQSNTIDSYDYAVELYQEALRYYDLSIRTVFSKWLLKLKWPRIGIDYELMRSQTEIGYARCLIYRRMISSLTGLNSNPLFGIPRKMEIVIDRLIRVNNKFHIWDDSIKPAKFNFKERRRLSIRSISYKNDTWFKKHVKRKLDSAKFEKAKKLIFDAYVVLALVHTHLYANKKAEENLKNAKAVFPDKCNSNTLYLLAKAEKELIDKKIPLLTQAREISHKLEIVQYRLAENLLFQFLVEGEINSSRAKKVENEFKQVLKINPGNIASLSHLGYLSWLINNLEGAEERLREGINVKAIAQQTFVGQLDYGLARITAEKGEFNKCYDLYRDSLSIEPGLGAYTSTESVSGKNLSMSYYNYINSSVLARYRLFKNSFENKLLDYCKITIQDINESLIQAIQEDCLDIFLDYKKEPEDSISGPGENSNQENDYSELLNRLITDNIFNKKILNNQKLDQEDLETIIALKKEVACKEEAISTPILSGILNRAILQKLFPDLIPRVITFGNIDKSPPTENSSKELVSFKTLKRSYSYVLNDYGNACLNYFHRFGDLEKLRSAKEAYEQSIELFPENGPVYFNLNNAELWSKTYLKSNEPQGDITSLLKKADKYTVTTWQSAIVNYSVSKIGEIASIIHDLPERLEKLKKYEKEISDLISQWEESDKSQAHQVDELSETSSMKDFSRVADSFSKNPGKNYEGILAPSVINTIRKIKEEWDDYLRNHFNNYDQLILNEDESVEKVENKKDELVRRIKTEERSISDANNKMDFIFNSALEISRHSKFSEILQTYKIDKSGKGVDKYIELAIDPDDISDKDVEVLMGWANLLVENRSDEQALNQVEKICEYLAREYHIQSYFDLIYIQWLSANRKEVLSINDDDIKVNSPYFSPEEIEYPEELLRKLTSENALFDDKKKEPLFELQKQVNTGDYQDIKSRLCVILNVLLETNLVKDDKIRELPLNKLSSKTRTQIEDGSVYKLRGKDLHRFNRILLEELFSDNLTKSKVEFYRQKLRDLIKDVWLGLDPVHYLALDNWGIGYGASELQFLNFIEIKNCLEEAIERKPENVDIYHEMMVRLFHQTDYKSESRNNFEEAIQKYPDQGIYYLELSKILREDKEFESAGNQLKLAKKNDVDREKYDSEINRFNNDYSAYIFDQTYGEEWKDQLLVVTPIAMEVANDLIPFVETDGGLLEVSLQNLIEETRKRIFTDLGVRIPGIRFRGNEFDLPDGTYIILLNEIPTVSGSISVNQRIYTGEKNNIQSLGIEGEAVQDPLSGEELYWIDKKDLEKAESLEDDIWIELKYPIRHLETVLRNNLTNFLGHQEVYNLIHEKCPDKLDHYYNNLNDLTKVTTILRSLVADRVSIAPLPLILEYIEHNRGASITKIINGIRMQPEVRKLLWGNREIKSFYSLGTQIENELKDAVYEENGDQLLAMLPDKCQDVLTAVRNMVHQQKNEAIIVEDQRQRSLVSQLLKFEFPDLAVVAKNEWLHSNGIESEELKVIELSEDVNDA